MSLTAFFGLLGGLLVLAFLANHQYRRTRVPDVIVLMAVGLLLGPVLGLVKASEFRLVTHAFGTLAIILILFEGGLELNLRETLRHFPGGIVLGILAYAVSLWLVALVAWWSLRLTWTSALLVGAVMGCTSSSIVLPVLQQMKLRDAVRVTLLVEASLADVFAVLTVKVLVDFADRGGPVVGNLVGGFFAKMLMSVLLALLAGWVWSRMLPVLTEQRFWNVLTFSVVLLLYAVAEALGGSGLIAVLGFGLVLANQPGVDRELLEAALGEAAPAHGHHQQVLSFHSELAFLVRTFFFVLLGVVVDFSGLQGNWLPMLGVVGAIIVGRWLAMKASRWSWRGMNPHEREMILWIMPRGLITAVLAIEVLGTRGGQFSFLPALTFVVILVTNVIVVFGGIRAARRIPVVPAAAEGAPDSA